MPQQVFVLDEKHGQRYFIFSTPEEKAAIALSVLRKRYEEGWYETGKAIRTRMEKRLDKLRRDDPFASMKPGELAALPAALRETAKTEKAKRLRAEEQVGDDEGAALAFAVKLEKLLKLSPAEGALAPGTGGRGSLALELLAERSDGEYEYFYIATPESY